MARPDKAAAVAELADRFRDSNAAVLTEYRGLTVAQLTRLRASISDHATYAVVKNTLTGIAAEQAGITAFTGQLTGPSAIAFVTGDPVETAKAMRDFARTNPALVIRGGYLEGKPLSAEEVGKLADLESREVLLARLAGAMKASLSNAAALFAAPLSQTARVLEALRQKREDEPQPAPEAAVADAPASESPGSDAPAAEAPSSETPAVDEAADAAVPDGAVDAAAVDQAVDASAEATAADASAEASTEAATDAEPATAPEQPAEQP